MLGDNKGPHSPGIPDIHMSKSFAPKAVPTSTSVSIKFLDRFYFRSGELLIRLGSALKRRSRIPRQSYEQVISEGY